MPHPPSADWRPLQAGFAIGALMAAAVGVGCWITANGPGYDYDSYHFTAAARTLREQGMPLVPVVGRMEVMSHWPPLYPLVLAGLGALGLGDPLTAARALGLALLPVNLLVLAALARRVGCTWRATVAVAALYVMTPVVLWMHVTAMAEVLCATFWLGSLWLMLKHAQTGRLGWLAAAGALAGACAVTRYAGLTAVVAGALFLVTQRSTGWRRKWRELLVYLPIALAPFATWQCFLHQHLGSFGVNRQFSYYALGGPEIEEIASAFSRWLLPLDRHPLLRIAFGLAVGLGLLVLAIREKNAGPEARPEPRVQSDAAPAWLLLGNLVIYEAMVLVVGLWFDLAQDFDDRMQLFPYLFTLLLAGWAWAQWRQRRPAGTPWLARGLLALILLGHAAATALWIEHADDFYLGFNSGLWRHTQALPLVAREYTARVIYSNLPFPLGLATGRDDIYHLPYFEIREQRNPQFGPAMQEVVDDVARRDGLIVLFKRGDGELELVKRDYPRLKVAAETPEAVIFEAGGPQ